MHRAVELHAESFKDDAWYAILHATEELLKAAQNASWDDLSQIAAERDALIRDYFSKPVTVDNALRVRDKLEQLLAMDDQVLGLARKEKTNLLPALKSLSQNKKAISSYQTIAG